MKIPKNSLKNLPKTVLNTVVELTKWKPAKLMQKGYKSVYILEGKLNETVLSKTATSTSKRVVSLPKKLYFKDFKEKIFKTQISPQGEKIIIKEKLLEYKWKLLNEKKIIDGIMCKKAISVGKKEGNITAWYSDFFGIQNGPEKFSGLPGLIVFLEHDYMVFKMKKIKIIKKGRLPQEDRDFKYITRTEYINNYVRKNKKGEIRVVHKENSTTKTVKGENIIIGGKQ